MQNGGLAINLTHDAEDKEWRLWSGVFLRSPRNESLKIKRKKKERDGAPGLNPSRYQLNMKIILLEGVTSLNVHAQESESRYPCLSAADPETSLHAGENTVGYMKANT